MSRYFANHSPLANHRPRGRSSRTEMVPHGLAPPHLRDLLSSLQTNLLAQSDPALYPEPPLPGGLRGPTGFTRLLDAGRRQVLSLLSTQARTQRRDGLCGGPGRGCKPPQGQPHTGAGKQNLPSGAPLDFRGFSSFAWNVAPAKGCFRTNHNQIPHIVIPMARQCPPSSASSRGSDGSF